MPQKGFAKGTRAQEQNWKSDARAFKQSAQFQGGMVMDSERRTWRRKVGKMHRDVVWTKGSDVG